MLRLQNQDGRLYKRKGERACNGNNLCININDIRNYKNHAYLLLLMSFFNYCKLLHHTLYLLVRLLALEKEVCWSDGGIYSDGSRMRKYISGQSRHWMWSHGFARPLTSKVTSKPTPLYVLCVTPPLSFF